MGMGAFIEFDVRRPSIRFEASRYGERRLWGLSFEIYFGGWHETVRINTGEEELSKLDGRLGFMVMDEHTPEGEKGQLNYYEGRDDDIDGRPPSYLVSLWVTEEEHERLIGLVQSGVPLAKVSIDAGEGVKYGWEPDGAGKDWDNKQFPKVTIGGFNLQFGADEDGTSDEDAAPSKSILDEPAAPDTFKRDALTKLDAMHSRLGWLLALLVAVAAVIHFR